MLLINLHSFADELPLVAINAALRPPATMDCSCAAVAKKEKET
jgi:hypothetical protein